MEPHLSWLYYRRANHPKQFISPKSRNLFIFGRSVEVHQSQVGPNLSLRRIACSAFKLKCFNRQKYFICDDKMLQLIKNMPNAGIIICPKMKLTDTTN